MSKSDQQFLICLIRDKTYGVEFYKIYKIFIKFYKIKNIYII